MNTDYNGKTVASTMVGDDLVKKINKGVNTMLVKENVVNSKFLTPIKLKFLMFFAE